MNDEQVLLFIDALEDEEAYLVASDDRRYTIPRAILPRGAKEGTWLRLAIESADDVEQEIDARRARMLQDDSGDDIKL